MLGEWDASNESLTNQLLRNKWRNKQANQYIRQSSGRVQDRSGRVQDRSGRVQDRLGRVQDRSGRVQVRKVPYLPVEQTWDYAKPCQHCKCVYLTSHKKADRALCCRNGKLKYGRNEGLFSTLKALPQRIRAEIFNDPCHYGASSALYNRVLSPGATFIDNGRGNRAERIQGNSCVTINGEVKYCIPKNVQSAKGGIHYLTYDGLDKLEEHADEINNDQSEASRRGFSRGSIYSQQLC